MEKGTPKLITAVNAIQFPVAQFLIRIYLTEASVTVLSDPRPKFRCYYSSCVPPHCQTSWPWIRFNVHIPNYLPGAKRKQRDT